MDVMITEKCISLGQDALLIGDVKTDLLVPDDILSRLFEKFDLLGRESTVGYPKVILYVIN